jgi:hypothetical protein
VVALLLNGVRVVTIVFSPGSETVSDHLLQGLAMIVVGVFVLHGLDVLLDRLGWFRDSEPRRLRVPQQLPFRPFRWAALAVALGVLGLAPAVIPSPEHRVDRPSLIADLPSQLGPWVARPARIDPTFYGSVQTQGMTRRNYQHDGATITLFASTDDRSGATSLVSPKTAIGEASFEVASRSVARVGEWEVERLVLHSRLRGRVLAFEWRRGVLPLGQETLRAALGIDRSPLGRSEAIRVLRIGTEIPPRPDGERIAEARLVAFSEALTEAPFLAGGPASPEAMREALVRLAGGSP